MGIDLLRREIDLVDDRILELLNDRANLALKIGGIKKEDNIAVYDPEREKYILKRLMENNKGPLDSKTIKILFERIIDESRGLERKVIDNLP